MADNQDRGGDNEGRGRGRNNKQPQEKDLSADPSYMWRLIKNMVGQFGNRLGKAGYEIGAVKVTLEALKALLGTFLTSQGIAAAAALVQEPRVLKDAVRYFHLPEQVNSLIDQFIDDVFEGVNMSFTDRGDKLYEKDVNAALAKAGDKLERLVTLADFQEAVSSLTTADQLELKRRIDLLTAPEDKEKFGIYRVQIKGVRTLHKLLAWPADQMLVYLELVYGPVKKPMAKAVTDGIKATYGKVIKVLDQVIPTVAETDRAAAEMRTERIERQTKQLLRSYPNALADFPLDDIVVRAEADRVLMISAYERMLAERPRP